MAHLAEVHISENLEHFADQICLRATMIQSHIDNTAIALLRLQSIVEEKIGSSNSVSEEDEISSMQISSKIDSLVSQARSAKVVSSKAVRQLEDLKSRCVTLDPSTLPTVDVSEQSGAELVTLTTDLGINILKLSVGEAQVDSISPHAIFAHLQTGPSSLSSISSKLQATATNLHTFYNLTTSLSQAVEFPAPPSNPPWKQLALSMKAANADLAGRELEMSRLKDEMTEKNTALAMKDKVAEEMGVKLEVLEKRAGESGERREKVRELEEAATTFKYREQDLQTRLSHLESSLQHAESERDKWQATAQTKQISQISGEPTSTSINPSATSEFSLRQISALTSEIDILQSTIRYLQSTTHASTLSSSLSFLSNPLTASPPPRQIQKEAKDVLKEMLSLATQSENQLIKLQPRPAAERLRWRPAKETATWQLQRQREDWEEWREWRDAVAKKAAWERRQRDRVAAAAKAKLEGTSREGRRNVPLAKLQVRKPGKGMVGGGEVHIVEPGEWEEVQQALEVRVG